MKTIYKVICAIIIIIIIIIAFQSAKIFNKDNAEKIEFSNEEPNNNENSLELEKNFSMQTGERFAKIGDTIIFSTFFDKSVYKSDLNSKTLTNLSYSKRKLFS